MPAVAAYTFAVVQLQRRGDRWAPLRALCFFAGNAILSDALLPPLVAPLPLPTFPLHVVQHVMIAMAAPLAMALSAPLKLALRTLALRTRHALLVVLHSCAALRSETGTTPRT